MYEQALQHYNAHLNIARDLKDIASEARALSNVGNYYSVRGEFTQAIPFYMQYLQVTGLFNSDDIVIGSVAILESLQSLCSQYFCISWYVILYLYSYWYLGTAGHYCEGIQVLHKPCR